MKRLVLNLAIIAFMVGMLAVIGQGTAVSEELIVNGDFETGDFTGWEGYYMVINDGITELPGLGTVDPISGNYDAWLIAAPPYGDNAVTYQHGILPSGISSATLSWSDRILSDVDFYYDPAHPEDYQVAGVTISDTDTGAIYDVFLTAPGDNPNQEGPNNRSFDLTSLLQSSEGHNVDLVFWVIGRSGDIYFAIDNVSLDTVTTVDVEIDIKPGSYPNSINLGSNGNVPVAILGSADFDATTVDPYSVTLAGAEVVLKGKAQTPMASVEDVNGDGFDDLVVHVDTEALEVSEEDTIAVLEGETDDGTPISGEDTVRVVP